MVAITTVDSGWLGESWGAWVQTGALIISAIGAVLIIWSRAKSERRRATVDLILEQTTNPELRQARIFVKRERGNLLQFLGNRDAQEYRNCMLVLNHYEFIAAALREGALDEDLFKRMQWTVVTRDWHSLCPFIFELRRRDDHPTLFQEFQWLAKKWINNRLRTDDGNNSPPN